MHFLFIHRRPYRFSTSASRSAGRRNMGRSRSSAYYVASVSAGHQGPIPSIAGSQSGSAHRAVGTESGRWRTKASVTKGSA